MMHNPMHPTSEPELLRNAARCGAKTRAGKPCRSPSVAGKRRCRTHGGAKGSGGPKGARNGNYKHGRHTAEAIGLRRWLRRQIREVRALTGRLRQV
jgi:glucans biosynthesis protein